MTEAAIDATENHEKDIEAVIDKLAIEAASSQSNNVETSEVAEEATNDTRSEVSEQTSEEEDELLTVYSNYNSSSVIASSNYKKVLPRAGHIPRVSTIAPKVKSKVDASLTQVEDTYLKTWQHLRHLCNKLRVRNFLPEEGRGAMSLKSLHSSDGSDDFCPKGATALDEKDSWDDNLELLTADLRIDWSQDFAELYSNSANLSRLSKLFVFQAQSIRLRENSEAYAQILCMYDSGASGNFLSQAAVQKLNLKTEACAPIKVTVASNSIIECNRVAHVPIEVQGYKAVVPAHVLPNDMEVDVILGTAWQDTLHKGRVWTSSKDHTVSFHYQNKSYVIECVGRGPPSKAELNHLYLDVISAEEGIADLKHWNCPANERAEKWTENDFAYYEDCLKSDSEDAIDCCYFTLKLGDEALQLAAKIANLRQTQLNTIDAKAVQAANEQLFKVQRDGSFEVRDSTIKDEECYEGFENEIKALLDEFEAVFTEELGQFDPTGKECHAALKPKAGCEHERPYRKAVKMNAEEREQLAKQLNELLEKGYIAPSASAYGAPALLVPKPHDPSKKRLVIDFRGINRITERDRYPLPTTDQLFEAVAGSKVFSTFDAIWGYWQMPIPLEEREKTAMVTPLGSYEWRCLPMGITNAPSVFMRMMSNAVRDLRDKNGKQFVQIFIDDILVHSANTEEHKEHIRILLNRLKERKIKLKGSKAQWFSKSVKFLGHVLTGDGIKPQSGKVQCIQDWPPLSSVTEIRQFLGLCGFYRRYINAFSDKAKPLNDLLKKDVEVTASTFAEGSPAHKAFVALKEAMLHAPVLILPCEEKARSGEAPFVLQTDASGFAAGAVLMQDLGQGLQPISFLSRSFNPAEQNYSTTERELLAIVHATQEWKHLLHGAHVVLQGDHKPLEQLFSPGKELSRRQARWIEHLIQVGVPEMQHVPGKSIPVPDALSRRVDMPIYTPREGLDMQLQGNGKSQVDPDLMTAWKVDTAELAPPTSWNFATGMCHYLHSDNTICEVMNTMNWLREVPDLKLLTTIQTEERLMAGVYESSRQNRLERRRSQRLSRREAESQIKEDKSKAEGDIRNTDWKVTARYNHKLQRYFGQFDVDMTCDQNGLNKQPNCHTFWHKDKSCLDPKQDMEGLKLYSNPPWLKTFVDKLLQKWYNASSNNPKTSMVLLLPEFLVNECLPEKKRRKFGLEVVEIWNDVEGVQEEIFQAPGYPPIKCPHRIFVLYGKARSENIASKPDESAAPGIKPLIEEKTFLQDIEKAYQQDVKLQSKVKELQDDPNAYNGKFRLFGNFVWEVGSGIPRLEIPDDVALRQLLLKEFHESNYAGHLGFEKTLEKLRRRFFWPRMSIDVETFCKGCHQCQVNNIQTKFAAGQRHPIPIPMRRWSVVAMDFITGLSMSKNGFDTLLTITDKLSKRVHLIPFKSKGSSAASVAQLYFDNVWRHHGCPQTIISDRDKLFVSEFYTTLHKLIGTQLNFTAPYHAAADGQSERTNQTVKNMLRKFINGRPSDWDLHLTAAEFAINDTLSVHGFTPFELDNGQAPSNPLDFILDAVRTQNGWHPKASKFLAELQQNLREARASLQKEGEKMRAAHAQKHPSPKLDFRIGDDVLLLMDDYIAPQAKYTTAALTS